MTHQVNHRAMIINALRDWIKQRPGLEFGNYGDVRTYRAELRSIARDRRDAETLLTAVASNDDIGADALEAAFRGAFSGRLSAVWCRRDADGRLEKCERAGADRLCLDYCTGQYWPTEYRRAACAVLASALWEYHRDHATVPGDIRAHFRREFGARTQRRWFD